MANQPAANRADHRGIPRMFDVGAVPTDPTQNASYSLSYTAGNLTQVDKVLNGVTYRKTLSYTGDDLTAVSTWSQV